MQREKLVRIFFLQVYSKWCGFQTLSRKFRKSFSDNGTLFSIQTFL